MPTLQDLRARLPLLEGLDDESAVLAIQQAYYPSVPVEAVAQRLGYTPPKPSDQPLPERSMLAAVNDTVIEAGNAVAGGVGSVANFVAPGNAVSSFIDENIIRPGKENQSDRKKAIDARLAADLAGAEGVGDELAAVGRYAASDPLGVIGQAAGSFVIPGAAVKGAGMLSRAVGLGGRATGAGMAGGAAAGAALSGGDAAGQAYEESLQAGATEDQAQAAARQASMIPAAVGAAGGMFGAERLLAGGRGFAGGAASRAIKSGLSEGAQEAIEEGVTQFEANRAVAPFDGRDPTKGVAAAGMLGALMGGPTGAAVSLMTPEPPKLPRLDKKAPSLAESLTKIAEAPTVDDAIKAMGDALEPAAKPEQAATGGGLDRLRTVLPDEQRREVIGLMATAGNPNAAPHVRRFAENRIDAIIREYTDIPVADVIEEADMLPTGEVRELTDAERADFASARRFSDERRIARGIPTGEATEALPVGDATEVEPIPVGDAAEAIPTGEAFETLPVGEATEAIPTGEATELPKRIPTGTATELTPEVIDGDLLTGDGMPYGSKAGALVRAKREGLTAGNVVEIPGAGYVVRPIIEARPAGTRGTGAADVLPKRNEPGVVERIDGEDGMYVNIASGNRGGFNVVLRDGDSEQSVGAFAGFKSIDDARAKAGELLGVKTGATNEPVGDMAGTAGEPVAAGAGRAPDAGGSGVAVGRVAADAGGREPGAAGTPVAGGAEAAPAGDGGGADAALRAQAIDAYKRVSETKYPGRDTVRTAEMAADRLLPAIKAKNADALIGMNLGSADMNPASRAVFEAITGIKLPKGRAATERAIDKWAGVTPEQRESRRTAKRQAADADAAQREAEFARKMAQRINVKNGDRTVDGAAWVDELRAKGFTNIVRRGPKTYLANAEGTGWAMPHKDIADYARRTASTTTTPPPPAERVEEARGGETKVRSSGPASAQQAIDAFNSDDSKTAMEIVGRLPLAALQEVGAAIGFRPQINENAKRFRERLSEVADKLTKTARETMARERKLFDQISHLASEYDRAKQHAERAKANGVTDPESTAFIGFYRPTPNASTTEMRIPQLLDRLRSDLKALESDPDFAKVSQMVMAAKPAIFEASEPTPTAAKLQARQERKARTERDEPTIELRKRLSVLRSLKECLG